MNKKRFNIKTLNVVIFRKLDFKCNDSPSKGLSNWIQSLCTKLQ